MTAPIPFRHRELGYVALNVTNVPASLKFHQDTVGLEYRGTENGVHFLRCGDRDYQLALHEAATPGVRYVAWEMESDADLEKAFAYLTDKGYAPRWIADTETKQLRLKAGFRINLKTAGICFEYFTGMARPPAPFQSGLAEIERLGHVVISASDFEACLAELATLGFLTSDHVAGKVAFLRAFPNPYHHTFAVQASQSDRLHHVNFMVAGMDTIGSAVNRLNEQSVPIVFGPGRHLPSGSIFLYFLDPDGLTFEYSAGMEQFPEKDPRDPRLLEPSLRTIDIWGGKPKPGLGAVGTIDSAQT